MANVLDGEATVRTIEDRHAVALSAIDGETLTVRWGINETIAIEEALKIDSVEAEMLREEDKGEKPLGALIHPLRNLRTVARILLSRHQPGLTDEDAGMVLDRISPADLYSAMQRCYWGMTEQEIATAVALAILRKKEGKGKEPDPPATAAIGAAENS